MRALVSAREISAEDFGQVRSLPRSKFMQVAIMTAMFMGCLIYKNGASTDKY